MHPLYQLAAPRTQGIIAAAIEVHNHMGPGLLESIYEWCLTQELLERGYQVETQKKVTVRYKRYSRDAELKFDLLVDGCVLVEIKAVDTIHPIHKAQLLSYMRLLDVPLGLLINFNVARLKDGLSRVILRGADRTD